MFIITTVLRAIGSIPGHATWTAISGYALGHYIVNKNNVKSLIDGNNISKNNDNESQWILTDKKTGNMLSSSSFSNNKIVLPKWLSAGENKMIKITKSPSKAILIAIFCHAMWNGTMWLSGILLIDAPILFSIIAEFLLIIILILVLWTILRRLIPSVLLE